MYYKMYCKLYDNLFQLGGDRDRERERVRVRVISLKKRGLEKQPEAVICSARREMRTRKPFQRGAGRAEV